MGASASYSSMQSCEGCSGSFNATNPQLRCARCERIQCRKCHGQGFTLLPCLQQARQCTGCTIELQRVAHFEKTMVTTLREGAMFSTRGGLTRLFSGAEAVMLCVEPAAQYRIAWRSLACVQNKPTMQGQLTLRAFAGVARKGKDLSLLDAGGSTAITLTGDKDAVVDVWEFGLSEMLSLKEALLGEPTSNPARLTATRNVAPDTRSAEVLLKRVTDDTAADRMHDAKQRLQRREQEAKERKAKYADVGMKNIAMAMATRGAPDPAKK